MKVYLISNEWRGSINRENMRVFDNLEELIDYAWDMEESMYKYNPQLHNYYITTGMFRCYEFYTNLNSKPINITKDIQKHFVIE